MSDTLTPRQQLVETLSSDLRAGPWNQPNKLWFLKGQDGDEWLEYDGDFTSHSENRLLDIAMEKSLPEGTIGICIASDGYDYPAKLSATLKAKGPAVKKAYWSLNPPSDHPQRVSTRNLMLACSDGEVIGLSSRHENEQLPTWAHLDSSTKCPTGNRTIDVARAVLGANPGLLEKLDQMPDLKLMKTLGEVLDQAINGTLDQHAATVALLDSMPQAQRQEIIDGMPDHIREDVVAYLTDEEKRRFGL